MYFSLKLIYYQEETERYQGRIGQERLSLTNEDNCYLESLFMPRVVMRTWLKVGYLSWSRKYKLLQ